MIPLFDLQAEQRSIRSETEAAVLRVMTSCQHVLGPEVQAFEREFAEYCGRDHGIGMNSGTSALHLSLLAAGVGPGDEVITTPFTFVATVSAIEYTGAKPVFVDINPSTFTMDPRLIEAAITPKTRAIIPVHLYGHVADMDPIVSIAAEHDLCVIEDSCQAHGAEYKGRKAGSLGDIGCFSFYPSKNLGACGDAGIAVTSNSEIARKMRMLRDWGAETKYKHVIRGFNARLGGLEAAVLSVKLKHLDSWNDARRSIAQRYNDMMLFAPLELPYAARWCKHVWHVYAVRCDDRDSVQKRMLAEGVQTGIHYPDPVHLLPAFADLGHEPGSFRHSERAASEVLSLPMYPLLTVEQQEKVWQSLIRSVSIPL